MNIKDTLLILFPIISALVSSYLTYYFTIKSKRTEAILKFKEEKYGNLLVLLKGWVGNTVSKELKLKFFEEQYRTWLYCSDEVVKAINDMVNLVRKSKVQPIDEKEGRMVVGKIVLAMRKDLLGNTKLSYNDFEYIDVYDKK